MKRSRFLASLAALAMAPFVQVDKQPVTPPPVITDPDHFTRMAMGPNEVSDIYNKTGNLVLMNPLDLYQREFHDRLLKRVPKNSARKWIEEMAARGPKPKATHYQFFDDGTV